MCKLLQKAFLWAGLIFTIGIVHAGSFMVDPVRIDLDSSQTSSSLVLRNNDQEPAVIQVSLMAWSQINGEDVYTPTQDILITPPIVTIKPEADQIIRLALRRSLDHSQELTYRIFLQEVPPPPRSGFRGLQVALRMSVPIFVKSNKTLLPKMQWKMVYISQEQVLRVELINNGNAHLHLYEFAIRNSGSDVNVMHQQTALYLLPGQHHEWLLKIDRSTLIGSSKITIKTKTENGEIEQEIELDKP
jgi:fimbrial chaperone protein